MHRAFPLSPAIVIGLALTAACASGCRGPQVWVAPEYRGPMPTASVWPKHGCLVCSVPACFGYHAGQWRPWPCPDVAISRPRAFDEVPIEAPRNDDLMHPAPLPGEEILPVPEPAQAPSTKGSDTPMIKPESSSRSGPDHRSILHIPQETASVRFSAVASPILTPHPVQKPTASPAPVHPAKSLAEPKSKVTRTEDDEASGPARRDADRTQTLKSKRSQPDLSETSGLPAHDLFPFLAKGVPVLTLPVGKECESTPIALTCVLPAQIHAGHVSSLAGEASDTGGEVQVIDSTWKSSIATEAPF